MILDIILSPEYKFVHNKKFIELFGKCITIDNITKEETDILQKIGFELRPFIKNNATFYFLRIETTIKFYSEHIELIIKKLIQNYIETKMTKKSYLLDIIHKNKD